MIKYLIAAWCCFTIVQSNACDICGSSSGNYFIGPFPQFSKHFIGTRYTIRSFNSHMANSDEFSKDVYQTTELWGGFRVGRKWQILAFIPFNFNQQTVDDGKRKSKGLGDATLMVNYMLINDRKNGKNGNNFSQQFWLGFGIKLPTGKFVPNEEELIPDANNQPGSGSVDVVVNSMYNIHLNNWGFNNSISYKINNPSQQFTFGNKLSTSTFVFHSLYFNKKATINPNVGVLFENLQRNRVNNVKVDDTGGHAALGAVGADLIFTKIGVGVNIQLPISQNLANNQTKTNVRGMLHVTILF